MIYIYLLTVFALLPIFAYILSQRTKNKGYIFGLSIIIFLFCIFSFIGKFSFLGSIKNQQLNNEFLVLISEDKKITNEVLVKLKEQINQEMILSWLTSYIKEAISLKKFNTAEDLISSSESYFITPEEKFLFYSLYTQLRDAKFPNYANSDLIIEFERPLDCILTDGAAQLFIMNGPNIPIANVSFSSFEPLVMTNQDSSIPGFDITSAYLNQQTIDMSIILKCKNITNNYSLNTSILFDSNMPSNTYKIKVNEWLKNAQ